jgi:hypothetical protein
MNEQTLPLTLNFKQRAECGLLCHWRAVSLHERLAAAKCQILLHGKNSSTVILGNIPKQKPLLLVLVWIDAKHIKRLSNRSLGKHSKSTVILGAMPNHDIVQ